MYILQVNQMNYALKFYIEQFIVDLDKVKVLFNLLCFAYCEFYLVTCL